jgi:hypothetical protein
MLILVEFVRHNCLNSLFISSPHHDIAEILLKLALNINQSIISSPYVGIYLDLLLGCLSV